MKAFLLDAVEKLIVNSRRLLILAGESDTLRAIEQVILSVPCSDNELKDNQLTEQSFCVRCLAQAQDRLTGSFDATLEDVADYFIDDLPKRHPRERCELEKAVGVLRGLRMEFQPSSALRVAV